MTISKETKCKSCGKPIAFIQSATTGREIPVDLPAIIMGHGTKVGKYVTESGNFIPSGLIDEGDKIYTSHFATCPDARKWRRK